MTIGERIRAARKKAGLTQMELADKMGVTEPAIRAIEIRTKSPRVDTIERIASALGVSPAWLCGWE